MYTTDIAFLILCSNCIQVHAVHVQCMCDALNNLPSVSTSTRMTLYVCKPTYKICFPRGYQEYEIKAAKFLGWVKLFNLQRWW